MGMSRERALQRVEQSIQEYMNCALFQMRAVYPLRLMTDLQNYLEDSE